MKTKDIYFVRFNFAYEQIEKNFLNALKDMDIAKKDKFLDVKFNYAYSALLKAGIALLSYNKLKARSVPGHHVKIIEKLAEILKDDTVTDIGNVMRSKRNLDLYVGGIEVTEKECRDYIKFVGQIIEKIRKIIYR